MSKKFLTVFAIVALLVAAMAGTAFAGAGDIETFAIDGAEVSNIGNVDVYDDGTIVTEVEADAFFVEGATKLVFTAAIGLETALGEDGGFVYNDVDSNCTVTFDPSAGDAVAAADGTAAVTFTITNWDPSAPIEIKGFGISGPNIVGTPIDITLHPVPVTVDADKAADFTVGEVADPNPFEVAIVATPDYVVIGDLTLYDEDDNVLPGGTILNGDDTGDEYLAVALAAAGTAIEFTTGDAGPGPEMDPPFVLNVVADTLDFTDADGILVTVAGYDPLLDDLLTLNVHVAEPAPLGGPLKATPSSVPFTIGVEAAPVTIKVSADTEIDAVAFSCLSTDAETVIDVVSGDEFKPFAFTFEDADGTDTSMDFIVAFDDAWVGDPYTLVISVDGTVNGQAETTSFKLEVKKPEATKWEKLMDELGANSNDLVDGPNFVWDKTVSPDITLASGDTELDITIVFVERVGDVITPDGQYDTQELTGVLTRVDSKDVAMNIQTVEDSVATFTFPRPRGGDFTASRARGAEVEVEGEPIEYEFEVVDDAGDTVKGPLKVVAKTTKKVSTHSSSGVGCDAGFGAFALLGLAGAAALLRKKD